MRKLILSLCLTLPFAACSSEAEEQSAEQTGAAAGQPASGAGALMLLGEDPGEATSVVAAKQAGPAKGVVVEGRVQQLTAGFAMLKLMDASLPFCGQEEPEDKCKTPWDYCCESKDDRAAHALLVEFRGDGDRPLEIAALPGTRRCDLVKVTGELIEDENGNPVLIAEGIYRVERPQLPDYVRWPSGN